MTAILTHSVVEFLVMQGYRYCLSKTSAQKAGIPKRITLTPVRFKPLSNFMLAYDTCFNIMHEPLQLANGLSNAEVLVNIDDRELQKFRGSISIL